MYTQPETRRRSQRHGPAAVTLTEVVMCVLTMALMSGISVATLARMRGVSQREACLNNLRRIGAATADYSADDPRDHTIPVHSRFHSIGRTVIGDYQYGGKSGQVDAPSHYIYTIEGNFGSLTRPLNPYLYDLTGMLPPECREWWSAPQTCFDLDKRLNLEVFHCPSDSGQTGFHIPSWGTSGRTAYDYFGTSYCSNQMMICEGAVGSMRSNTPFLRPREAVPNPARTVLYMETNGRYAWAWGYGPWAQFGIDTDFTVRGWHGDDWRFNTAFVDGRAQTITMRGSANGGAVNSATDVEYVPGLPGGMADWWQIITRGPGWQRDTLPSQPIGTNKNCGGGIAGDAPAGPGPMSMSHPDVE